MAAGDNGFDNCPVCNADNRYVNMDRFEFAGFEYFNVMCTACSFAGPHDPTRKGATVLWNLHERPNRAA